MSDEEIRTAVLDELGKIAPEIDGAAADPSGDLREEFDIDSMDFLNLVTALHDRLGIDIPEADYPKLFTLNDAVAYLSAHR